MERGLGIDGQLGEQLLGLLDAALPDAQVRKPDRGTSSLRRAAAQAPQPDGLRQRRVGLRPAAGGSEHPAVVRMAERGHRRQPVPCGDGFTHPDPLIRATNVVCVLAGREQLAEDLLDGANVVYLVSDDRGEGLVEKWHAVVSAIVVHRLAPR